MNYLEPLHLFCSILQVKFKDEEQYKHLSNEIKSSFQGNSFPIISSSSQRKIVKAMKNGGSLIPLLREIDIKININKIQNISKALNEGLEASPDYISLIILHIYLIWIKFYISNNELEVKYDDVLELLVKVTINSNGKWKNLSYSAFYHFFAFLIDTVNINADKINALMTKLLTLLNYSGIDEKAVELLEKICSNIISRQPKLQHAISKQENALLNFIVIIFRTYQKNDLILNFLNQLIEQIRIQILSLDINCLLFFSRTINYMSSDSTAQEIVELFPTAIVTYFETSQSAAKKYDIQFENEEEMLPLKLDQIIFNTYEYVDEIDFESNFTFKDDFKPNDLLNSLINQETKEKLDAIVKVISNRYKDEFIYSLLNKCEKLYGNIRFINIITAFYQILIDISPIDNINISCLFRFPTFSYQSFESNFNILILYLSLTLILKQNNTFVLTIFNELRSKPLFFSSFIQLIELLNSEVVENNLESLTLALCYSTYFYLLNSQNITDEISSVNEQRKNVSKARNSCFSVLNFLLDHYSSKLFQSNKIIECLLPMIFEESPRNFVLKHISQFITSTFNGIENSSIIVNNIIEIFQHVLNQNIELMYVKIIISMIQFINSISISSNFIPLVPKLLDWFKLNLNIIFNEESGEFRTINYNIVLSLLNLLANTSNNYLISKDEARNLYNILHTTKKFYPTELNQIHRLLLSIISGTKIDNQQPQFIIKQNNILLLLTENKDDLVFLKLLISYSPENALLSHNGSLDLFLLNKIKATNDIEIIECCLDVFYEIAKYFSSVKVANIYMKLISDNTLSNIHISLLNMILKLIDTTRTIPPAFLSQSKITISGFSKTSLSPKFSICFWFMFTDFYEDKYLQIIQIDNKYKICFHNKKFIFSSITNDDFQISESINETIFDFKLTENRWHHINFSIKLENEKETALFVMTVDGLLAVYYDIHGFDIIDKGCETISFSSDLDSDNFIIGPCGIFPYLKHHKTSLFIEKGIRNNIESYNPIIYVIPKLQEETGIEIFQNDFSLHINYEKTNAKNEIHKKLTIPFIDVIVNQCGIVNYFLPLFDQSKLNDCKFSKLNITKKIELLIEIICNLIKLDKAVQDDLINHIFKENNAIGFFSYLLYDNSCFKMTSTIYMQFINLLKSISNTYLKEQICDKILLNFDLIVSLTENEIFQLLEIISTNVKLFMQLSKIFGFTFLLNVLRIYFYYEPIESDLIKIIPQKDSSSTSKNIQNIRKSILSIAHNVTNIKNLSDFDFQFLISQIVTNNDEYQRKDLTIFAAELIIDQNLIFSDVSIQLFASLLKLDDCFIDIIKTLDNCCSSIFNKSGDSTTNLVQLSLRVINSAMYIKNLSIENFAELFIQFPRFFLLFAYIAANDGILKKVLEKLQPHWCEYKNIWCESEFWCFPIVLSLFINNNDTIDFLANFNETMLYDIYLMIIFVSKLFPNINSINVHLQFIHKVSQRIKNFESAESFFNICQHFLFFYNKDQNCIDLNDIFSPDFNETTSNKKVFTFHYQIIQKNNDSQNILKLTGKEINDRIEAFFKGYTNPYFKVNVDNKSNFQDKSIFEEVSDIVLSIYQKFPSKSHVNLVTLIGAFKLPDFNETYLLNIIDFNDDNYEISAVSFYNKRAQLFNKPIIELYSTEEGLSNKQSSESFEQNSLLFLNQYNDSSMIKMKSFISKIKLMHDIAFSSVYKLNQIYNNSLLLIFSDITQDFLNQIDYNYFTSSLYYNIQKSNDNMIVFHTPIFDSENIGIKYFSNLVFKSNKHLRTTPISPIKHNTTTEVYDTPKKESFRDSNKLSITIPKDHIPVLTPGSPIFEPQNPLLSPASPRKFTGLMEIEIGGESNSEFINPSTRILFSFECILNEKNFLLYFYNNFILLLNGDLNFAKKIFFENIIFVDYNKFLNILFILIYHTNEPFALKFTHINASFVYQEIIKRCNNAKTINDFIDERNQLSHFDIILWLNLFDSDKKVFILPNVQHHVNGHHFNHILHRPTYIKSIERLIFSFSINKNIDNTQEFEQEVVQEIINDSNSKFNLSNENIHIKEEDSLTPTITAGKMSTEYLPEFFFDIRIFDELPYHIQEKITLYDKYKFIYDNRKKLEEFDDENYDKWIKAAFSYPIFENSKIMFNKTIENNIEITNSPFSIDIQNNEGIMSAFVNHDTISIFTEKGSLLEYEFINRQTKYIGEINTDYYKNKTQFITSNLMILYGSSTFVCIINDSFPDKIKINKKLSHEKINSIENDGDILAFYDYDDILSLYQISSENETQNLNCLFKCSFEFQNIKFSVSQNNQLFVVSYCLENKELNAIESTILYYSINNQYIFRKIHMENEKIHKVAITNSWCFIVLLCENTQNTELSLKLLTKSGKIIIERKIPQMISHWVFWTTQRGFDILSYIDIKGNIFMSDVFLMNFDEPLYTFSDGNTSNIANLLNFEVSNMLLVIQKDGTLIFVPYKL